MSPARRKSGRGSGDGKSGHSEDAAPAKPRRWPWIAGLFVAFVFGRCTADEQVPLVASVRPEPVVAQSDTPQPETPGQRFEPCSVTRVNSGERLDIICGDFGTTEFRLLHVEVAEPDAWDARNALGRMVGGKTVTVEMIGKPTYDDEGRLVLMHGYVFVNDLNVNVEMVRRGHAHFADPFEASLYADAFRAATERARARAAGGRP